MLCFQRACIKGLALTHSRVPEKWNGSTVQSFPRYVLLDVCTTNIPIPHSYYSYLLTHYIHICTLCTFECVSFTGMRLPSFLRFSHKAQMVAICESSFLFTKPVQTYAKGGIIIIPKPTTHVHCPIVTKMQPFPILWKHFFF